MKRRLAFCLICCCLLFSGACQTKKVQASRPTDQQDSATVEYYNDLKAPEWTVLQGVKGNAYQLSQDADHSLTSSILENKENCSLSFWLKPTTNKPSTYLFSLVNESGEFLRMTNLTSKDDGTYQGLSLEMKVGDKDEWIVSNSAQSLSTYKNNYVVLNFENNRVHVYLNGQPVVDGTLPASINSLKNATFTMGKDTISYLNFMEGQFQDFKIEAKAKTAQDVLDEFNAFYPEVLLSELTFTQQDDLRDELALYPQINNQFDATWTSSNPEVIEVYKNRGLVHVPTAQQGDQRVTLTISTTIQKQTYSRDFEFVVRAESAETSLYRDEKQLPVNMGILFQDQMTLPQKADNGSEITWKVTSGEARIEANQLLKTTEAQKASLTLTATLTLGTAQKEVVIEGVIMDRYAGYILSYFNGNPEKETGKLAYSTDGLHWQDLNDGKSILTSSLGTGRIRDPFITRDAQGNFMILATEGYDNPSIYFWKSENLIDFTDHSLQKIAYFDQGLYSTGNRAWAPEMMYDPATKQYVIYFSDAQHEKSGSIFSVTTQDFQNFSYPKAQFNPGYQVIDGTIVALHGQYWMIYKDEREAAQTIFYSSATSLSDTFSKPFDSRFLFEEKYIEGPFILPNIEKQGEYFLYVDNYPNGKFFVARFSQLGDSPDFTWLEEGQYTLPNDDVRHGSAIAVTQKELDAIKQYYK